MRRKNPPRTVRPPSITDREQSLEGDEFLWDDPGASETHNIVIPPIVQELQQFGARKVLDIGAGNGAATRSLAEGGFDVVGIDSSLTGIRLAKSVASRAEFEVQDIQKPLPPHLSARFDAVVSIEVIEHLFKPRDLLRRAAEALRPGGLLLLTTPYHGYLKNVVIALTGGFDRHVHPLRDYGHVKFFSVATLSQLVGESGFRVERVRKVGRVPVLAKSMILTARLQRADVPQER